MAITHDAEPHATSPTYWEQDHEPSPNLIPQTVPLRLLFTSKPYPFPLLPPH